MQVFISLSHKILHMKNSLRSISLMAIIFMISLQAQAQRRVGYIVQVDSMMKQLHLGMTSFTNFSSTYSLPFELHHYTETLLESTFGNEELELIKMDPQLYQGYLNIKKTLTKKEFKVYQEEWFKQLKKEYQIEAFMVIHSAVLEPYKQQNMETELGQIAMTHENNKTYVRVFIEMEAVLFVSGKGKAVQGKTSFIKKDDFPGLRSKTTPYTEEEIGLLEYPLQELIQIQLEEIKESKTFKKIIP